MIRVTEDIAIDEWELQEEFVGAPGPGGQHVNKVATAVKLRLDAARSPSLPEDVRDRLIRLAGRRSTEQGLIIIDARRFHSQERNRAGKPAQAPLPKNTDFRRSAVVATPKGTDDPLSALHLSKTAVGSSLTRGFVVK